MISVLIVDDHTLVRQGIRSLLELDPGIEVIGEARDGLEAVEFVEISPPQVVLLDLRMPAHDGLWTLQELRARGIDIPVLVLTTFDDDELVIGALQAGAKGYLLKDVTFDQLGGAIRELAAGRTLAQRPSPSACSMPSARASTVRPSRGWSSGSPIVSWTSCAWSPAATPTGPSPMPCTWPRGPSRITSRRSS